MRTIKIENDKLLKILSERGVIYKEIGEVNEQIVKLDEERTKLGYKMERLKEKTSPIITELTPSFELGEFEVISSVRIGEDGQPEVEIADQVEEYINLLKEQKHNSLEVVKE